MTIKAKYEDGHFIPLEDVNFNQGEIIEFNIVSKKSFSWRGSLKGLKAKSVDLQHKIKKDW